MNTELTDKQRIGLAFRKLRSEGLRGSTFARQSFSCCQGCGCSEIDTMKGVVVWVFYNKQADDAFKGNSYDRHYGINQGRLRHSIGLSWGLGRAHRAFRGMEAAAGTPEATEYDEACAEWGKKIVAALTEAGLAVEWNGTVADRVLVSHLEPPQRLMLTVYVEGEQAAATVSGLLEAMKQTVPSLDYDQTWEMVKDEDVDGRTK